MNVEKWVLEPLNELTTYIARGITPVYSDKGDCIIINQRCIRNGKVSITEARKHNISQKKITIEKQLIAGDILINSTGVGTLGRVGQIWDLSNLSSCDSHVTIARPNERVDKKFLGYALRLLEDKIELLSTGTTGQTELPREALANLEIFIPQNPETQRRIAAILTALDDKIELNRRMNETLEGIAQAVWGEWFGKYASGEEELPEGWRWGHILEIAKLLGGGTPKTEVEEYWNGEIPWISGKDITPNNKSILIETEKRITKKGLENSSAKLLPALSTIISARGTVGNFCLIPSEMTISQSNYALKSIVQDTDFFLFQQVANIVSEMQQKSYGTVFDTITTKTFSEIEIPLPPTSKMVEYNELLKPIFEKRIINLNQSRTLTALRDLLLPRLMRGELAI